MSGRCRCAVHALLAGAASSAWAGCDLTTSVTRPPAPSGSALKQLSVDLFNNGGVDHETEVEPDTYAYGDTIVAAF